MSFINKIKDFALRAWQWVSSGWTMYIIVFVIFIVLLLFDRNSPIESVTLSRKIERADNEIKEYQEQIDIYQNQIEQIKTSDKALEEYAREHYYMKAADEDVYIVNEGD